MASATSAEATFIARLRAFATHPAARGLADDAAVLATAGQDIVATHDMLVEGVHYLASDPPEDVAWKLVAVNLSDLAAKGARPLGVLLGYPLCDDAWDAAFAAGLETVLLRHAVPLLGGDTVRIPPGAPRTLGLTALGAAPAGGAPSRGGARAGDGLWVTGRIGAAGLGLAIARGDAEHHAGLLAAYRRPEPRLAEGLALAPLVHAMSDVSDGLLLDARRMAEASGLGATILLEVVPIAEEVGSGRSARLAAAAAGDDYELLFAARPGFTPPPLAVAVTRIGAFIAGTGLHVTGRDGATIAPERLGYEH